jgi:hypothetical protein
MGALETLRTESAVVFAAPWSFAICIAIAVAALWAAFNWRYGGMIAQLKERLDAREDRIKYLESHSPSGAVRAELAELKRRLEPRRLTEDERFKMVASLMHSSGSISVEYSGGADSRRYAHDFKEVFDERGWTTRATHVLGTLTSRSGLMLGVDNLRDYNMAQSLVADALIAAGIHFDVQHIEMPNDAEVRLTVTEMEA